MKSRGRRQGEMSRIKMNRNGERVRNERRE